MSYTKGPWLLDEHGELCGGSCEILRVTSDYRIVCNNPCNKSLIEAAPEILEALKELRACIDETRGKSAHEALIKADKAIKKAEGGE